MNKLTIPVILGTGRKGRKTEAVAKEVHELMNDFGFDSELIDVLDYPSPFTTTETKDDPKLGPLSETIRSADGYVIVSPEYNHGYPGELKIFLDHFYKEYAKKPVGIVGVSDGAWGGARMIEALRGVLGALDTVALQRTVLVRNAGEDAGLDERQKKSLHGMLEQLEWYADALRSKREGE